MIIPTRKYERIRITETRVRILAFLVFLRSSYRKIRFFTSTCMSWNAESDMDVDLSIYHWIFMLPNLGEIYFHCRLELKHVGYAGDSGLI